MKTTQTILWLLVSMSLAACQPSNSPREESPAREFGASNVPMVPRADASCITVLGSELLLENGEWVLHVSVSVDQDCSTLYSQGFTLKAVRCSGKSYVVTLSHDYALEPGSQTRIPLRLPVPASHCFSKHAVEVAYAN